MPTKAQKIVTEALMPAGTYIVGDPCYAVPDERWMEWLEAADYTSDDKILLAHLDGHPVLGIGTARGDGCYGGSDGNSYPVDTGLIGLVPVELDGATKEQEKYSEKNRSPVVKFERDFRCSYEDGTITLGHIEIETDPDDDYDDDAWGD